MSLNERQIRCRTVHSDAEAECSVHCGTVAVVNCRLPVGHRLLIHVAIAAAAAAAADGWITGQPIAIQSPPSSPHLRVGRQRSDHHQMDSRAVG